MTRKTRTSVSIPVPADTIEANSVLERIGEIERSVADIEAAFTESVATLRRDFDVRRKDLDVEYEGIVTGLQIFADQNRASLLTGDLKTVKLSAGLFGWRLPPAKVSHGKIKEEAIIERIKALGKKFADKYIRTYEALDKEAMLKDRPEISGVKYPQVEKFFYEAIPAVADEEAAANVVSLAQHKAA